MNTDIVSRLQAIVARTADDPSDDIASARWVARRLERTNPQDALLLRQKAAKLADAERAGAANTFHRDELVGAARGVLSRVAS